MKNTPSTPPTWQSPHLPYFPPTHTDLLPSDPTRTYFPPTHTDHTPVHRSLQGFNNIGHFHCQPQCLQFLGRYHHLDRVFPNYCLVTPSSEKLVGRRVEGIKSIVASPNYLSHQKKYILCLFCQVLC